MILDLILISYIGINCFFAGYYFNNGYNTSDYWNDKLQAIGWALIHVGGAIPIIVVMTIWLILEQLILNPINNTFQVRFWFNFVFTDKWKTASQETLYNVNEAARKRGVTKFKDRMFKYGVIWINELNQYEHKPTKQEEE